MTKACIVKYRGAHWERFELEWRVFILSAQSLDATQVHQCSDSSSRCYHRNGPCEPLAVD